MHKKKLPSNVPNAYSKEFNYQPGVKKRTPQRESGDTKGISMKTDTVLGCKATGNAEIKSKVCPKPKVTTGRNLLVKPEPTPRDHQRPLQTFRIPAKNPAYHAPIKLNKKPAANFIEENIRLASTVKPRQFKPRKNNWASDYPKPWRITKEMPLKTYIPKEKLEKENHLSKIMKSLDTEVNFPCAVEKASDDDIHLKEDSLSRILKERSMSDVNCIQKCAELKNSHHLYSSVDSEEQNEVSVEKVSTESSEVEGRWIKTALSCPLSANRDTKVKLPNETSSEYIIGCSYAVSSNSSLTLNKNIKNILKENRNTELGGAVTTEEESQTVSRDIDVSDSSYPAFLEPETEDAKTIVTENIKSYDSFSLKSAVESEVYGLTIKDEPNRFQSKPMKSSKHKIGISQEPESVPETVVFAESSIKSTDDMLTTDHKYSVYETTECEQTSIVDVTESSLMDTGKIKNVHNIALNNFPVHIRVNTKTDPPSINVLEQTLNNSPSEVADIDETYMMAPASSSHFCSEPDTLVQADGEDKNLFEQKPDYKSDWKTDQCDNEDEDNMPVMCQECAHQEESSPYCMCSSRPDHLISAVEDSSLGQMESYEPPAYATYMVTPEYQQLNNLILQEVGSPGEEPKSPWAVRYQSGGSMWEQQGDWTSTARILQELSRDLEDCQYQADRAERQVKRLSKSFNKRRRRRNSKTTENTETGLSSSDDDFFSVTSSADESDYSDNYVDSSIMFRKNEFMSSPVSNKIIPL